MREAALSFPAAEAPAELGVPEILKLLPHRYPMLLIDRVERLEPGRSATAIKCVTANEPFLVGHFPEYPIMPGVLIVDAFAQLSGIMMRAQGEPASAPETASPRRRRIGVLASIRKMRFLRPVFPGDRMWLTVTHVKTVAHVHQVKAEARVEDQLVAAGELVLGS